jgi:hypothetical protein
MAELIDVREVMREIQERANRRSGWQLPEAEQLKRSVCWLRLQQDLIAKIPPSPPTLRGWIGAVLVKAVRRSLFWYTTQLLDFHSALVDGFQLQAKATGRVIEAVAENKRALDDVRERLQDVSARLARVERALSLVVEEQAEPERTTGA